MKVLAVLSLAVLLLSALQSSGLAKEEPVLDWPEATGTSKPWTRWWWPGSAVDEQGITEQLQAISDAGMGGVEITPIYGARGWEAQYVEFLSPRWVELLEHVGREAERLGLGVDMATGTGWPFGGPTVEKEEAAQKLVLEQGEIEVQPTGQKVKRAAPGGAGWVLDPYSESAIKSYLDRFDKAFAELPNNLLRSQFHDSFEYYDANWTDGFARRFEELNGYSIHEYLPALLDDEDKSLDVDTRARIKHDYRQTLDALHQSYLRAWNEWAHTRGWLTRNQSHGAPANLLDLYEIADIPETEVFGSTPFPIPGLRRDPSAIRTNLDLPEPLVTRMASSAAHVAGKPLASSETATWLRDHWKVTLAYVKPEIDRIFLDGINHVFYHGMVYSPTDIQWPGWLFYASTQFNPSNPWWKDFGSLNRYVQRAQSILQGGQPDNDVLLYWPASDLWQDAEGGLEKQLTVHHVEFILGEPVGKLAQQLTGEGYAFDYVSARQIEKLTVSEGMLRSAGGSYAALVVPPARTLPVATLEALLRLAESGGTIAFSELPKDVPGYGNLQKRRETFADLKGRIELLSEKSETLVLGDPLGAVAKAGAAREPMVQAGIECIRRKTPAGYDYFIANLGSEPFDGWLPLGRPIESARVLDPLSGEGGGLALRRSQHGRNEARLQLKPGQSLIIRGATRSVDTGPTWSSYRPLGDGITLRGPWEVEFLTGGPELPEGRSIDVLSSWTEWGDEATVRFSGTARFTTRFNVSDRDKADNWLLDLGDLRDSARVYLNGEYVGTVWSLPFEIRLGDSVRPGENELTLEVTNIAANRVRDLDRRGVDWKIMREINFVDINYRPFDASGWEIEPAGLLGPVTLVPLEKE